MEEIHGSCKFFFVLFFSNCLFAAHGMKQRGALGHIYKAKLQGIQAIDTGNFQTIQYEHEAEIVRPPNGSKKKDRIKGLPGQPRVEFEQFGGYITVNESAGRALYYYFVEADHSKKQSLPLLLWLNGGPGCSSLLGAMTELGPFQVRANGKSLNRNEFAWNKVASVLFLETPAGTGFSYSNSSSDYKTSGDKTTAEDNYVFLLNWLKRFPEYKTRDFYISGESYAGHFVPELAYTILHGNRYSGNAILNLKGIMIGNAVINDETDLEGLYDYWESHAIISEETASTIHRHCDFSPNAGPPSRQCNSSIDSAWEDTEYIDMYSIYTPLCHSSPTADLIKTSVTSYDPCTENYLHTYLNRPEVQKALHANVTKLKYDWQACSSVLGSWKDSPSTIIPLLRELMANRISVWIFSGDTDGVVPVTSTKRSIKAMKLPVKTKWYPWLLNAEVGGFTQLYEGNLTLVTVRGAGHMVPSHQPERALFLISNFLAGTPPKAPTKGKN